MLHSGILTASSSDGWGVGVLRAMPGYETAMDSIRRVTNVTNAINDSFPAAFGEIEKRLGGISLDTIKDVLRGMLKDVAIILGGSTVVGTGIGAAAGAFAFGIGAIPGAAIGSSAGFEMGNLILTLTGLKSIVSFMAGAVPAAIRCYVKGFRDAWGERNDLRMPWASFAYKSFAEGHVLFVMAILMGIVGYLLRGKGDFPILLGEIRASAKLGPKFADWIAANKDALMRNPTLQQSMRASAGGSAADAEASSILPRGSMRGSPSPEAPMQSPTPLTSGAKGLNAPWGKGATNIKFGKTFTQCADGSCVSATGQVLTGGAVTEQQLLSRLGEWSNPEALADELNAAQPGANWTGGYLSSEEDALAVANAGPSGVVLQAPGAPAHMVTIEPITGSPGNFLVTDTGEGATYQVTSSWVKQYVAGGVWK